MSAAKKLLFVSNGHGEDAIAAQIVRRLPPGMIAQAYPTLGSGHAYDGICEIVGPRAELPSQGGRNISGSVRRDVTGGGLGTLWPGIRFFRSIRGRHDRVVVIGDMIGVYGCFVGGLHNIVYVDVYKTGFGKGYLGIDRFVLRRVADAVFCRAEVLAESLRRGGIAARCTGNVMMDTIPRIGAIPPRRHRQAIAVLPGSRSHAAGNFAVQAAALAPFAGRVDILVAVAAGLDLTRHEGMTFVPGAALGDVLDAADVVLTQAGTATVQALGLGKPCITFRNEGDRPSRFVDEQRLFGESRRVVPRDPDAIGTELSRLLSDDGERERLGGIGKARVGSGGALENIIAAL